MVAGRKRNPNEKRRKDGKLATLHRRPIEKTKEHAKKVSHYCRDSRKPMANYPLGVIEIRKLLSEGQIQALKYFLQVYVSFNNKDGIQIRSVILNPLATRDGGVCIEDEIDAKQWQRKKDYYVRMMKELEGNIDIYRTIIQDCVLGDVINEGITIPSWFPPEGIKNPNNKKWDMLYDLAERMRLFFNLRR